MKFRKQTTDSSTDFKTNFLKFTAFTKNTLAKRVGGWMKGSRSTIGIYGFHEQTSTVSENEDQNLGHHNGDGGENVT